MSQAAGKTLFLRNLPAELVREAKAAAAQRGETLTKLVSDALTRSLRVEDTAQDPADDLQRDMMWYRKHQPRLLRRYRDQYVAIADGAVVDHGSDFAELATRVFTRFGNRSIYMPRVQAEEPVVRIRSPRRLRP